MNKLKEFEGILKDQQKRYFEIFKKHGVCIKSNKLAKKIEHTENIIEKYKNNVLKTKGECFK